jgi:beta-galactosidase
VGGGAILHWREFLILGEKAEADILSDDDEVTLAHCGSAFYLAGWPDDVLLRSVLNRLLSRFRIPTLDLPEDIRVRDNGVARYIFSYGALQRTFPR